jgi:cellulose biosynthesis protein BcsQ
VGKSTLAANLAAYCAKQNESVTLLDLDTQGSSSSWLNRAPSVGVIIQHHVLPWEKGSNRPLMDARLHLRRAASSSDVVICDLTWTDSMADELLLEFDAVIVPTSVAEIELASTTRFLNNRRWIFNAKNVHCPDLMLCPSRVQRSQLDSNAFAEQRFAVSFLLSPPVLESQSARDCYESGYLMDMANECGQSFIEFAKAVNVTREIRQSRQALNIVHHNHVVSSVSTSSPDRATHRYRVNSTPMTGHHKQFATARLMGHSHILSKHQLETVNATCAASPKIPDTAKTR